MVSGFAGLPVSLSRKNQQISSWLQPKPIRSANAFLSNSFVGRPAGTTYHLTSFPKSTIFNSSLAIFTLPSRIAFLMSNEKFNVSMSANALSQNGFHHISTSGRNLFIPQCALTLLKYFHVPYSSIKCASNASTSDCVSHSKYSTFQTPFLHHSST